MTLTQGTRLGAHEIVALLGAGGMGEVYRARDTRLNREVAIKVLPDLYARDPERIGRFHREAQAVAALNHANIAAIHDLAESDGTKYLVLELIEGDTLAERLRRGPVPIDEALQIAKQILEALEAAHEKGICHRDLKPANIKLTPDGTVKVLDFGLAKFLQNAPSAGPLTQSPTFSLATYPGVILGTAAYMSPEAAKGFEADQRSDIFAFGCILYELLAGRQAFDGETASEILASVLKSEVNLAALPARLNPRLIDILRRCLEKNPKKRWHAAADVRVELEAVIPQALIREEPRPAGAAPRPLWQRALALALAATAGAGIAGYAVWRLKPEAPQPVGRFTVPLPEGQRFTGVGRHMVAVSPDGTALVYTANAQLYVRPLAAYEPRQIAGIEHGREHGRSLLNPAFSPDGQSVAFYSTVDNTIKRVGITGGVPVTICRADVPFGLSWTEHGIVFGQNGKGILMVDATGGTPRVVATVGPDEIAGSPHVLPGGRAVLFTLKRHEENWDSARLVAQPLAGGERKIVLEGGTDARYVQSGHLLYAAGGVIMAVPFDVDRLDVTGTAAPVVEGVRRAPIAASGAAQFAVSRTGTLAYVPGPVSVGVQLAQLALFDRQSKELKPLNVPPANYSAPRVSPDGSMVVVQTEDEREAAIWTYALDGGTAIQRLTLQGNNRAPIWSPDGRWVAFESDREGNRAIFRQRADGSGVAERLTSPAKGETHIPQSWSPDGMHVLFTVHTGRDHVLAILSLRDRGVETFDDIRSTGLIEAAFSPNGRWFLYQLTGEELRVFLEPFPRTGAKYQVPRNGGHPMWSPRGDELRMSVTPTQSALLSVRTEPRVGFGVPQAFVRANDEPYPRIARRNLDSLPDGQHFVGVVRREQVRTDSSQINIVLNWFEELRERVAPR